MTERLDRIARRNQEAERILKQINAALDKHNPIPFDPGNLKDLVIYDWEGDRAAKFPLEHTTYAVHDGMLLIECYGEHHTYHLDRYSYCTEGR